jgi:lipoyl synthase
VSKLNILPENPEDSNPEALVKQGRFPSWLHRPMPQGASLAQTEKILSKYGLNTVCREAKCPNQWECYSRKTATFLVLGKQCTRNCGFCAIDFSTSPKEPDKEEPEKIAFSVRDLGLKHVVITMVARDDLEDGGAHHLVKIMEAVRAVSPTITLELLISDLGGSSQALESVLDARPDILNHNIETVRSLSPRVRHRASYDRSLKLLKQARSSARCGWVKSGLMLGLGEQDREVEETLQDLFLAGCDIVTMGQYLQADRKKLRVKEFISPERFKKWENFGKSLGIKEMYCGPFIRSSYNASEIKEKLSISS